MIAAETKTGDRVTWTDETGHALTGTIRDCPGGVPKFYEAEGWRYFVGDDGVWRWIHPKREVKGA